MVKKIIEIDIPKKGNSIELFRSHDHNIVATLNGDGEIWFYVHDDGNIVAEGRILKLNTEELLNSRFLSTITNLLIQFEKENPDYYVGNINIRRKNGEIDKVDADIIAYCKDSDIGGC